MRIIFGTLGRYFAARFLVAIVAVFITVFLLVLMIDLIELVRRAGETEGATTGKLARLALYRTPAVAEQVLPFAVLFAALTTFLNLSRKLELVVARAAGISAWQFSAPIIAVAALIGVLATTVYNPLSTALKDQANRDEAAIFSSRQQSTRGNWLRQRSIDGEAILQFSRMDDSTLDLFDVTAFILAPDGTFLERVEAERGFYRGDHWRLESGRVLTVGIEPQPIQAYLLPTYLQPAQIRRAVGQTHDVSIWSLPGVVRSLELAGLDTTRYRLRYQSLLARPALLIAMVIIAASVSLRFMRSGGFATMILSGVAAGFVLYVASRIVEDLGNAGFVSTVFAAWAAPTIGAMLGSLTLLYREDG